MCDTLNTNYKYLKLLKINKSKLLFYFYKLEKSFVIMLFNL